MKKLCFFHKNIFAIISLLLVVYSCTTTYHYFPSYQPSPSFHQKKEIQINTSYGSVHYNFFVPKTIFTNPICIENYIGYSITNNVYLDLKSSYTSQKNNENGDFKITYFNSGLGLGYFKWISNVNLGARLGFSYGSSEINMMEYYINGVYFKSANKIFSLTPFLGYQDNFSQIILQINCQSINYSNISNNLGILNSGYNNLEEFKILRNPLTNYFVEPSFTLKSGNEYIKFVFQEIISYHLGNRNLNYLHNNAYIGLEFTFKVDDFVNLIRKGANVNK